MLHNAHAPYLVVFVSARHLSGSHLCVVLSDTVCTCCLVAGGPRPVVACVQNPRLLDEGTSERPDYQRCIAISTRAALKYMVPPGALVMLAPLVAGTFFGVMAVCGLLTGEKGRGRVLCSVVVALV